ncbi:MAG: hypothetical protein IJY93_01280 [Clostridia bacterium]|nr:hypothetical protein [Clostridia bacterium]
MSNSIKEKRIKEKKAAKVASEKQQDAKLYRLMLQFALVFVAVVLAIRTENNQIIMHTVVLPPFLLVMGILFGLSAILFTFRKMKNVDESGKVLTSAFIFGNITSLFASGLIYYIYDNVELVIATLITLTVLYFAHNIYAGNFFAYSSFTAAGFLLIRLAKAVPSADGFFYTLGRLGVLAAKPLMIVLALATIALGILLIVKNKNYTFAGITIGGKKCAVTFFICAAAVIAGLVLLIASPASTILADFILLASYLVIAVICTVKMI